MAISVPNTDITNTFDYWRNRTNDLAAAMSTKVVTTGGLPAQGNSVVTGDSRANTVTVGLGVDYITIRPPTQSEITNGYVLCANGQWASQEGGVQSGTTPALTPFLLDSINVDTFSGGEYKVFMRSLNINNHSYSKVSMLTDRGQVYITEYGVVLSNNVVGFLNANVNAGVARLYLTPSSFSSGGVSYKIVRTLL